MCTALSIRTKDGYNFFGRNMDLEYYFNQAIQLVPRNFSYKDNITGEDRSTQYAMMGMGTLLDGKHPTFAEGVNEKGLACAGLNFYGYAYGEERAVEGKFNIAPYDIILWILSNFETVEQVKRELVNINIVNKPFNNATPLPTLHWIIVDKEGQSIVVEKTKEKLAVYDNEIGVLTNSPTFDWHITNLRQYMGVQAEQPQDTKWHNLELTPLGQGGGSFGLPGDFATAARFIRIAFLKSRSNQISDETNAIRDFFHMLSNVAMVNGAVTTPEGKNDRTLYTSCINQSKGIYYYTTYNNSRINAIDMHKENLDAHEIKVFEYKDVQDINYQN